MFILCDTSSILMLFRLAPDMFTSPAFECITLQEMHNELKRTPRFKDKYPWIKECLTQIKAQGLASYRNSPFPENLKLIDVYVSTKPNEKTGRFFNLSYPDKIVITYAVTNGCRITTGDRALADFAMQEFEIENISALGLLNHWIEKGVITIDKSKLLLLEQWDTLDEPVQPAAEKLRFKKLTGYSYPGA